MSTHSRLLAYADTPTKTHPLFLVVGREASQDAALIDGIGDYDFDAVDSRFWTTAYSTLARVGGTNLYNLREACRKRRSSPIVFADALPRTSLREKSRILNRLKNNKTLNGRISLESKKSLSLQSKETNLMHSRSSARSLGRGR